jgi:hypothetical protein
VGKVFGREPPHMYLVLLSVRLCTTLCGLCYVCS